MEYIKTVLNGIGQRLADVSKRVKRGNWQQNDPSAWDYIENRPGGYDAETTTDYIIDRSNTPIIDNFITYFNGYGVVARLQLVSEETVPAGNWENIKAIRQDGSAVPNAEVFNPSKDISYVSGDGEITNIGPSKIPWVVMVRTAGAKWLGRTFNSSGTYFFRIYNSTGKILDQTEQISCTCSAVEPVKISSKYLDLKGVVSHSSVQSLTDIQKARARANIGAGTSNFSGAYSDLTGAPVLGVQVGGGTESADGTASLLIPEELSVPSNALGLHLRIKQFTIEDYSEDKAINLVACGNTRIPDKLLQGNNLTIRIDLSLNHRQAIQTVTITKPEDGFEDMESVLAMSVTTIDSYYVGSIRFLASGRNLKCQRYEFYRV